MAKRFLIGTTGEQSNMVSTWSDELYCTVLKDGSISLRACKDDEDEYGGSWWFPSIRGIKTPKSFVDAFSKIEEIDTDTWSIQDDILPKLFEAKPLFSVLTHKYIELEYEEDEVELDFFLFAQIYFLKSVFKIPSDFSEAVKLFSSIFEFVKTNFRNSGDFPKESHVVNGVSIMFPKRVPKSNIELDVFRTEQLVKAHVQKAKWYFERTRLAQQFGMEKKYKEIKTFCSDYFLENGKLPIGTFLVGDTEVIFTA